MLAYYPLEHLYYLLTHSIIPDKLPLPSLTAFVPFIRTQPSDKSIPLDAGALSIWSTRFWAAYVILQLAHLREDGKLLLMRERALSKSKVRITLSARRTRAERCEQSGASPTEKEEIRKRKNAIFNEWIVNLAYLPQTIHWYAPLPHSSHHAHPAVSSRRVLREIRISHHRMFSRDLWLLLGDIRSTKRGRLHTLPARPPCMDVHAVLITCFPASGDGAVQSSLRNKRYRP